MTQTARILVLLPPNYLLTHALEQAARKIPVEILYGTESPHHFSGQTRNIILKLRFRETDKLIETVRRHHRNHPFAAVLGVDIETTWLAALIADTLELLHHPIPMLEALRFKHLGRQKLLDAGLPIPRFFQFSLQDDPDRLAQIAPYPCVLKPTFLSAGRGIFVAENAKAFHSAFRRIREIVAQAPERLRAGRHGDILLVEDYIEGKEIVVAAYLQNREAKILNLVDQQIITDHPALRLTLYTAPSRLPFSYQQLVERLLSRTIRSLGFTRGPLVARFRINDRGLWLLDVLPVFFFSPTARLVQFPGDQSLEELWLREMLGEFPPLPDPLPGAAGILTWSLTQPERVDSISGIKAAQQVEGIEEVSLIIPGGKPMENRCLGFILARGKKPEQVEQALQKARNRIHIRLAS